MSKRKEKQRKKQAPTNFIEKFRKRWQSRYTFLLFVGCFALLMGAFYAVWLSQWFMVHVDPSIFSVYATLSSKLLNLFAQNTLAYGEKIYSPVFSYRVAFGCDAVEAMALFSCVVLSFPAKWKTKIIGLAFGIPILFVLNIIRLVTLFLTGKYYPGAFQLMHVEVWQVIFIILSLVLWITWLRSVVFRLTLAPNVAHKTTA